MVKQIIIDENASKNLKGIIASSKETNSKTGLLIGSISQSVDYVLYVASTSPNETQEESKELDQDWILNHALQIHDMLVGGMDILGLYCVDIQPTTAKQLLHRLFKTLTDFDYYKRMCFNSERLLFLVDSETKNINMKSLDVSNLKATFQQCELKTQPNLLKNDFIKLNSNLNLNSVFKTPNVKSYNLLKEDFHNALSTEEMLDEKKYVCLINNMLIDEKMRFVDVKSEVDKNQHEKREDSNEANDVKEKFFLNEYESTLLENLTVEKKVKKQESQSSSSSSSQNLESIYELTGVANLVIFFHKSNTVQFIKKLLVYDLMRSLYARVRLLVEDLDARKDIIGDDQIEDPNCNDPLEEAYQTPNRIHVNLKQGDTYFLISDYVFPDETDSDIADRVRELLNYEINEKEIVFVEDLPPEIKRSNSEELESGLESEASGASNTELNKISNQSQNKTNQLLNNGKIYASALIGLIVSLILGYYSFKAANFITEDEE